MRLTSESVGSGDFSWMASNHGSDNCRTSTVVVSNFTKGTHYPNGYIPSGTPVDVTDEKNIKPWADAAGKKLGFIFGDHKVADGDAKFAVPVFRHGMVRTSRVPGTFAVPTTAAQPQFVFIEGSDA